MKIVVIGGSAAGLVAAILLGRLGHEVVVVERDSLEPAPDVETAAATAFRATAPQIVQPHTVLALCRQLLRERSPDVICRLYPVIHRASSAYAPSGATWPPTSSSTPEVGDHLWIAGWLQSAPGPLRWPGRNAASPTSAASTGCAPAAISRGPP